MCRKASSRAALALAAVSVLLPALGAQVAESGWRRIGNASIDLGLASLATGPVDRVWFSADGAILYARSRSGKTFETKDFERWETASAMPPSAVQESAATIPEPAAVIRAGAGRTKLYGLGTGAYRSDDGGYTWSNLSQFKGTSLLGSGLKDLAVSPRDPDEIAVAGDSGVWHSVDGGLSWSGLNQSLPNLPVQKITSLPGGMQGLRLLLALPGDPEIEWTPGERTAWRLLDSAQRTLDQTLRAQLSRVLGATVTASGISGSYVYAGTSEGQLQVSADRGTTWGALSERLAGPIEGIYVSALDGRIAVAAVGGRAPNTRTPRVVRTMNGGIFWDDLSANLPDVPAHGVTADPGSGAIYVATDNGVFMTGTDLAAAARPTAWITVSGKLPAAPAMDVRLDAAGNQLFVALAGPGVFATIAPHRIHNVRVVNAADYSARPAAPGGLLTVLGANVRSARAADTQAPVLAASDAESQIQVPFDVSGPSLPLTIDSGKGLLTMGLALQRVSPAIFVDPEGSPIILDADSGVMLDATKPAHAKSRIQILTTGLGRVSPDWPAGVAAPVSEPPKVMTSVNVYLDRIPLVVTQAVLAPGLIGYYLIEAEIPAIVNQGPAELFVEADGHASNHVRVSLAQ